MNEESQQTRLGELIRAGREVLGLRPAGLARKAKVDRSTISRLERGEVTPTGSTLSKVFMAIDNGLQQKGQRREFLDCARELGVPIPTAPNTSRREDGTEASGRHSQDRVEGVLSEVGLNGAITPEKVRHQLPVLCILNQNGAGLAVADHCARIVAEIRAQWGESVEAAQLISDLLKEQARAYLTTSPTVEYGTAIRLAERAQEYALDGRFDRDTRQRLWSGAALVLGNAARIIEDDFAIEPSAKLRALHNRCLKACQGYPLEDALETDVAVDRAWARAELTKKFSREGDLRRALREFRHALDELDSSSAKSDIVSTFARPNVYEAGARAIIRLAGPSDEASVLLDRAQEFASLEVNKYQIWLSRCELLLSSKKTGMVLDGRDMITQLVPPDSHQRDKTNSVARRFEIALPTN